MNKLRHFAADIFGVAWCRIQTAVAATHEDELFGISRSTFDRMLRRAKEINLITVKNQYRDNHAQKHNVFIFNRLEEIVPPKTKTETSIVSKSHTIDVPNEPKIDAPKPKLLLELPKLNINTYLPAEPSNTLPEPFEKLAEKPLTPYQQFKQALNGLFNDRKIIYRLFGAWLVHARKGLRELPFELCLAAVKALVKEVNRRYRENLKPLRNPVGYFNNTLVNMIDHHYFMELEQIAEEEGIELNREPFVPMTIEEWQRHRAIQEQRKLFKTLVGF